MSEEDEMPAKIEEMEDQEEDQEDYGVKAEQDEFEEEQEESDLGKRKSKSRISSKSKKKKKSQFEAKQFFEDEASENDEESEGGGRGEITKTERDLKMQELYSRKNPHRIPSFLTKDEQELQEMFAQQEEQGVDYDEFDEEGLQAQELQKQELQPTHKDPKLFSVGCRLGSERKAAYQLMNKYLVLKDHQNRINIYSVNALDKFQGVIFIEADKEINVKEAVKGMGLIHDNKIRIVPLREVIKVFTPDVQRDVKVDIDQWIRIKVGKLYGGDLGRIAEIIEGTSKVIVRLVPRLTPEDKEGSFNSRYRFAKRFFDPTEYKEVGKKRDPATDITYMMYKNMIFHDGYLLKKMNTKNLELKAVNPSLEEIQFFLSREDPKKREEVLKTLALLENRRVEFIRGDMVRIIKGELTNLCGTIKNIQEDDVTIQPTMKELAGQTITVNIGDIVKHFEEGDNVRVIHGRFKGTNGTITALQENMATLISNTDNWKKEINVFVDDLKKIDTAEQFFKKTVGYRDKANYNKYDFIQLLDNNVGVVLSSERDIVLIMDQEGQKRSVQLEEIDCTIDSRFRNAFNNMNQTFNKDSTCRIKEGLYKGKIAYVKHIYKDRLFLYNKEYIRTAGIFVENVNNCFLLDLKKKTGLHYLRRLQNPNRVSYIEYAAAGKKQRELDAIDGYIDLIGKSCYVCKGPWKGYQGMIKDANEKTVRLELSSVCKIITLTRDKVRTDEEDQVVNEGIVGDENTPGHQSQKPMASPMYGQSPAYRPSPAWGKDSMTSPAYNQRFTPQM